MKTKTFLRGTLFTALLFAVLLCLQTASHAGTVTSPFYDNMENTSATLQNWTTSSSVTVYQPSNGGHSGNQCWRLPYIAGSSSWSNYMQITTNINTMANPYLSFWMHGNPGAGNGAYFWVQISQDGGSTWSSLPMYDDGGTNQGSQSSYSNLTYWLHLQTSLLSFKQATGDVTIRITSQSAGETWIDDVSIDNAPTPHSINTSSATNDGFTLSWGQSTDTHFKEYRVLVSTEQAFVNSYNANPSLNLVQGRSEYRIITIITAANITTTFNRVNGNALAFTGTTYYAKVFELNNISANTYFYNQGTTIAPINTTSYSTNYTAPFTESFSNTNIGTSWSADLPWTITNTTCATGSAPYSFESNPSDLIPISSARYLTANVNIGTMTKPLLHFKSLNSFAPSNLSGSHGQLYVNGDLIADFTGQRDWQQYEFNLMTYRGSTVPISWHLNSDASSTARGSGWNLDEIEIVQDTRASLTFPFYDNAEDATKSQNTWIMGEWERYQPSNGGHSGNTVYRLPFNGTPVYKWLTLAPIILYSNTIMPNPYLSFWLHGNPGVGNGSAYFWVQVSQDGGQTWSNLPMYDDAGTQQSSSNGAYPSLSSWVHLQTSLLAYKQPSALRFRIAGYGNGETWLDDICINNAPTPQSINISNTTNDGFTLAWGQSTDPYFQEYHVLLSTDQSWVNTYKATSNTDNSSTSVSNRSEYRIFKVTNVGTTSVTFSRANSNALTFTGTPYYVKIYEVNNITTGTYFFYNQGTNVANANTTSFTGSYTAPFTEQFDNLGTLPLGNWAADLPWAITNTDQVSGANSYESNPGDLIPYNSARFLTLNVNIPSTVSRPILKYQSHTNFSPSNLSNLGALYVNGSLIGEAKRTSSGWLPMQFDLSAFRGSTVPISFQVYSDASTSRGSSWFLDDVGVIQDTRSQLTFPYLDNTEDINKWNNSYILGEWDRFQPANGGHSGTYAYRLAYNGSPVYKWLTFVPININSAANPYLSFWLHGNPGVGNGSAYFWVQVSQDGGQTWSNLPMYDDAGTQQSSSNGAYYPSLSSWVHLQTSSLVAYKQAQPVMFRIAGYGNGETWLDDIYVVDVPQQVSPFNSAINVPTTATLQWTGTNISTGYTVQVSNSSNFSTIVTSATTGNLLNFTFSGLAYSTTYYWRVRGENTQTSWSGVWSFTTVSSNATQVLGVPTLISPADGATNISSTASLSWSSVPNATLYNVQASISSAFSPLALNVTGAILSVTTSSLSSGTTYYWRVNAQTSGSQSLYSISRAFATAVSGSGGSGTPSATMLLNVRAPLQGYWTGSTHKPAALTVEIRSGSDLSISTLVARGTGITSTNGTVSVGFSGVSSGQYWIIVRSSGHIPVASANLIQINDNQVTPYDFSTSNSQDEGFQTILIGGAWCMKAGDVNGDASIDTDYNSYIRLNGGSGNPDIPQP